MRDLGVLSGVLLQGYCTTNQSTHLFFILPNNLPAINYHATPRHANWRFSSEIAQQTPISEIWQRPSLKETRTFSAFCR